MVLLVRHGKTPTTGKVLPGRAAGLHLSEEGRAQAQEVGQRLEAMVASGHRAPVAVYASPLERTMETARPIARCLGLRVRTERGLLECEFGEWTGAKLSSLAKKPEWAQVQRCPSGFRFPGGESFPEMQARMASTITRLRQAHQGETIVAVSHADPIKAAVSTCAGTPLDLFQRLMVSPCSVSALVFSATGPHVVTVNSTASLGELAIA